MKRIENDCVGCEVCCSCGLKRNPHYYCDKCKTESTLYYCDGDELCADCILKMFPIIEGSDY